MPYVSKEDTKQVRQRLKKELPDFKFSVRTLHHSEIAVTVLSGEDLELTLDRGYEDINLHWYKDHYKNYPKLIKLVDKVLNIMNNVKSQNELVYDGDYGSVPNYYQTISIGRYGKPYIIK